MVLAVLAAIAGTLALVVLALNLFSGERKIDHRIHHVYDVGDGQFVRSMGNLLGPPLEEGNSVVELIDGDRIFPAMLEAIRGPDGRSLSRPTSTGPARSARTSRKP
jgi:cardiolipin synthase A/B